MLEFKGKSYARVSDVLRPFTDFGDIDKGVLAAKASLGTLVHQYIEQDVNGIDFLATRIDARGYFKSFKEWRKAIDCRFVETQMRYYCDKKMITGEIDALVEIEGEKKTILVDWKTSVQESPTWIMQGHLYHYLLIQNNIEVGDRILFIKLDKTGKLPKVFEYKLDNRIMEKCLQAIDAYWTDYNLAVNLLVN